MYVFVAAVVGEWQKVRTQIEPKICSMQSPSDLFSFNLPQTVETYIQWEWSDPIFSYFARKCSRFQQWQMTDE